MANLQAPAISVALVSFRNLLILAVMMAIPAKHRVGRGSVRTAMFWWLLFAGVPAAFPNTITSPTEFRLYGTVDGVDFKYDTPANLSYFVDLSELKLPPDLSEEEKTIFTDQIQKVVDLAFKQWSDATKATIGSTSNVPNVAVLSTEVGPNGNKVRELTTAEINELKALYGNDFDVNYRRSQTREGSSVIVRFVDQLPATAAPADMGFWHSGPLVTGQKFTDQQHTIFLENSPNGDDWFFTFDSNKDAVINNADMWPLGAKDLYSVVKHEIGHDLGSDHPPGERSGQGCPGACVSPVPEPSTLLLLGSSLAGLGGFAWRRQRRK